VYSRDTGRGNSREGGGACGTCELEPGHDAPFHLPHARGLRIRAGAARGRAHKSLRHPVGLLLVPGWEGTRRVRLVRGEGRGVFD
jgi:hypothetical protein